MGSLRNILLLFTFLRVYCCNAIALLVFPEGEVHSILCTTPDEDHFGINWGTGDGGFLTMMAHLLWETKSQLPME